MDSKPISNVVVCDRRQLLGLLLAIVPSLYLTGCTADSPQEMPETAPATADGPTQTETAPPPPNQSP